MPTKTILLLIVAFLGFIIGANCAFVVQETSQAMVLRFGRVDRQIAEPGLYFKIPIFEELRFYDKRILETDSAPEEIQSQDKKRLVVDSFTRWRIKDAKKFYETLVSDITARNRLNTIVNSNIKRVLASQSLNNVISGERASLMNEIESLTQKEVGKFGVEIVDVRIKRADLPAENSRAVFNRMKAEREKEAKEIRAKGAEESQKIRADAEKQRTIMIAEAKRDSEKLRGKGDAEAIRIYADAFGRDLQFFDLYRSLEAYRNGLQDEDTLMVLDPDNDFLRHFRGK